MYSQLKLEICAINPCFTVPIETLEGTIRTIESQEHDLRTQNVRTVNKDPIL